VAFFSEKLSGPRLRFSTYDEELYVAVRTIYHRREYLYQQDFILYLDHEALKYLNG
jgi:hypothetical protein